MFGELSEKVRGWIFILLFFLPVLTKGSLQLIECKGGAYSVVLCPCFLHHMQPFLKNTISCRRWSALPPVSPQECRVESTGSLEEASLPSPPWTPPTRQPCPSRPRTCWCHPESARSSPMSAAPSASSSRSICSSSPFCGSLSWMWVYVEVHTHVVLGLHFELLTFLHHSGRLYLHFKAHERWLIRYPHQLCSVPSQISNTIWENLENEVIRYNFKSSFFDIFVSGAARLCTCLAALHSTNYTWSCFDSCDRLVTSHYAPKFTLNMHFVLFLLQFN